MTTTSVKPKQAVGLATARSLRLLSIVALVAAGGYGADECATSAANCEGDDDCRACLNAGDVPTDCATTAITCDGWWDMACCTYGTSDACLDDTLLLSHLQCLAGGNDCTIDGVCPGDSADRSVVVDAYNTEDTACLDAFTNCINDSECLGCVDVVPGDCSAETATNVCGAVSEMLCCAYGTNTVCQTNGPLIAYTACVAGLSGCMIDGVCPEGQDGAGAVGTVVDGSHGGGDDVDVDVARSSGDAVTFTAALVLVLPMFLSAVAVFL